MRRHLPAAGARIAGADAREEHLVGRDAECQAQRAVAVIGIEPVVCRLQGLAGRGQNGFVSRTADLKKDQALTFELDFLVVDPPRQDHRAVRAKEIFAREAVVLARAVDASASAVADSGSLHAAKR